MRRRLAVLLVAFPLAGCQSWRRTSVAPGAVTALTGDHPVRVTRTDRSTFVLDRARVVGDSIVGETGRPAARVAVPISDVASVEERRVSAGRTLGAVAGGVGLVYAALFVLFLATVTMVY
jgi:hypothetical protein